MLKDTERTKQDLFDEIVRLQQQLSEKEGIQKQLESAQAEIERLKKVITESKENLKNECALYTGAMKELQMAQLIVERSPVVLFRRRHGDDPKLEYISQNLMRFGYTPEEFLRGEIMFKDIVHPDDQDRVHDEVVAYAEADVEEYSMFYRCMTRSGEVRWVEDQTSVVRDDEGNKVYNQGVLFDITERKLAEDALKKSEEKFRRIVETAGEGFVLMDEDLKIVDVNKAYCRMIGYDREDLIGKTTLDFATDDFREQMVVNKEALLAKEYREFEGELVAKAGHQIPILVHGNTLRDDSGNVIGNMAFVTDMTEHKKALALAGEVQKSLLPQDKPVVKGLDIAGRNVSCDEIGGDYFDFLWRKEVGKGPLNIVVGDISGHGVDSALLMTTARAFLRMRASQPGTISEIISAMNAHLTKDVLETGRFMTLFYLSLDPEKRAMEWVRAGHDPALLYDPSVDSFEELKGSGIALGVTDDATYSVQSRGSLSDGQIIAIGTDGIWEAFNVEGKMFGKERFRRLIRDNSASSASTILNTVYDELKQFTMGRRNDDDITLVIIKVTGLQ